MYLYSKPIKEGEIEGGKIERTIDERNIEKVVNPLIENGKRKKFEEIELRHNCRVGWKRF